MRAPRTGRSRGTRRRRARAAALLVVALGGSQLPGCHGPARDQSRFESAALLEDRTVLFSYKRLVYRPARGIAAFPDGGIPRYVQDEDLLGVLDLPSRELHILRRERNRRWSHGQGRYAVQRTRGRMALVTQGGQLRDNLSVLALEDWLVDVAAGTMERVRWREALSARGLRMERLELLDDRGTLLFVAVPLEAAPGRPAEGDAAIWIRTPGDEYLRVAPTSHYEGMEGDELVYWLPGTRRFRAFDVVTRSDRDLPGYRVQSRPEVTAGVLVPREGGPLQLGRKGPGGWEYEPLPIDPDRLR